MNRYLIILYCLLLSYTSIQAAPLKQYNVDQAISLFKQKDYNEALKHFQALLKSSHKKQQTVRLQWNVARCLEKLGRYEEALTEFYGYRAIVLDPKRKQRAKRQIAKLIPKVYGSLKITCTEDMSLNVLHKPTSSPGKTEKFGPRPCPSTLKKLRAGRSKITAFYDGSTIKRTALITPGAIQRVHLKPPPKAGGNGLLIAGVVTTAVVIAGSIYLLSADDSKDSGTSLCFDCP